MRDLMRRVSEGKLRGLFSGTRLRNFFLGSRLRRLVLAASTLILVVGGLFVGLAVTHAAAYCKVTYSVTSQWPGSPGGFNVQSISIQNTSSSAWTSWSLTWTFPDANQKIPNGGWNGNFTQSGQNVTVTNMSYNGSVAANASVNPSPGFNGTWTTANPVPTNFAVNGNACNAAPPTVSLTNPSNNATYTAPANIPLAATAAATATGATISRVDFMNGSMLIASVTTSPYTFSWNGVTAGTYQLTAVATDSNGTATTSSPVTVTVTQPTTPTILTTTASVSVAAGGTATFGVSLNTAPSANVTVAVARTSGSTSLTVSSGASLTFTPTNFATSQTVTIAAASGTAQNTTATFTASATNWTSAAVTATVVTQQGGTYTQDFLALYNKIKNPANGYFSSLGIPYHSVETLMVEAPDYGHETVSETYSYWIWLEATYGEVTGNWQPFNNAWTNMETYIIPSHAQQGTANYNPNHPADYAPEAADPSNYPTAIDTSVSVGQDPLYTELTNTYGNTDIYGMHWIMDTDNWYGFGQNEDGTTKPSCINTYQRGPQESVWETIPQPCVDTFKYGGPNGFLDLFHTDTRGYSTQWKYTDAPDADARAIQAAFWAFTWSTAQGKESQVATTVSKAAKMGDYLRYSMYDKYFKALGCTSPSCPAGQGKNSSTYLLDWYYAWGGAYPSNAWSWRIGSSAAHFGYQNPLAAYALSNISALKPLSPTAAGDWQTSLGRQLEFYTWLQSAEGAIAGGATNSWNAVYGAPPAGTPTFYGMAYDFEPVYHDPPSNNWFGFQAWSMERVAEYYDVTGDAKAKAVLDKWVNWVLQPTVIKLNSDGTYQIPSTINWSGAPNTWNPTNPQPNTNLHVTIVNYSNDVGITAATAKTLEYYAAKSGSTAAKTEAKSLLDRMWTLYSSDPLGLAAPESRSDYTRFGDPVFVPSGWTGTYPNGATIKSGITFIGLRPKYQQDPQWSKVQAYLNNPSGPAPTFTYHRMWQQADVAMSYADYDMLFPNG
jgi:hypothetical protein